MSLYVNQTPEIHSLHYINKSISNISISIEDYLSIKVLVRVVLVIESTAELIHGLSNLFYLIFSKWLCLFHVSQSIYAFLGDVKLKKILMLSVCDSPLEIFFFENLFLFTLFFFLCWLFLFLFFTFSSFFLFLNNWFIRELFILNFIFSDEIFLFNKLKTNDCFDLSENSFNTEEFIHKSHCELVINIVKF